MIINKKDYNKKWHKFDEETSVLIRPFPFSEHKSTEVMEMAKNQFFFCLEDWKGLKDSDGKIMKCTDDNKILVYDYVQELRDFIIQKSIGLAEEISEEVKN